MSRGAPGRPSGQASSPASTRGPPEAIFGSIQSVARAGGGFFRGFSLVVVDECHRVPLEGETQYAQVLARLHSLNPGCASSG